MSDLFKVSGKKLELPATPDPAWKFTARPGGWIVAERTLADGAVERRRFAMLERQGKLSCNVGGFLFFGEVVPARASRGGAAAGGGDADLVAQFPGKVRKILAQEGATVKEGEPLLLVEAMKMEFQVKAPYAGKVKAMLVKEGQQLSPGTRFLELEEDKSGA